MRTLMYVEADQMSGVDVDVWKQFLASQGYDVGNLTGGTFGPKTLAATVHFQRQHGLQALGIVGPKTLAVARGLGFAPATEGSTTSLAHQKHFFSEKALQLILDSEGLNQPGKWPGGDSGVTIGIGYDLGHVTASEFEADWGGYLPAGQLQHLKKAIGLRGPMAKGMAGEFSYIRIGREDAEKVFEERTLPRYLALARGAFPGFDELHRDAQGALVSLVYNRGAAMHDDSPGDRRREMRAVRDAVTKKDLEEIARQIRAMKRLWEGKGLGGLLKRREAEADLVDSCIA